jgi:hypothetical protein
MLSQLQQQHQQQHLPLIAAIATAVTNHKFVFDW